MLAVLFRYHWSALTGIILAGLLLTTCVEANSIDYTIQPSISGVDTASSEKFAYGRTISIPESFSVPETDVLPLDSSNEMYTVALSDPIAGTRRGSQFLAGLDDYGARTLLPVSTMVDSESDAAPPAPDSSKLTSTDVTLSLGRLFIYLTPLKETVASRAKVVPRPAALILLGTGLLVLAFGIRRITAREKSDDGDDRNVSVETGFAVDARLVANDPESEPADPVAPLFHQSASGQRDSISMSQPS